MSEEHGSHFSARDLLIEEEMKQSYLTYAMSVLIDRALPDIRDGLKPVHRRILYSMRDLSLNPGSKYQKSAKIVGQCIGNYHPHGDTAVYDAMVRMAQDFSLRYELVDGQGNFGSIDGDAAAAYRYTEARMTKIASEMLEDIQYDTVDHRPNFDGSRSEPTVLPSKIPNLLVNGSSGIAVGMATNMAPHNLGEVCRAAVHLIDNPESTVSDLMEFIQAPDFPTGGIICGTLGVRQAYETGRGRCVMRSKVEVEEKGNKTRLVVTEVPYGVKVENVKKSILNAYKEEKVQGLSDVSGGTTKEGVRLVLELKRGEDPDVVLNQLWKHTNLQYNFGINMVALDNGRPRTVNLKRLLQAWVEHRIEVIVRRTRFLLARDEARLHIVEGLLKAIDIIDEIIALIRASASADEAKEQLMARYDFSDRQAQAILDMQLRRLTGLERDKLLNEQQELEARIADYRDILANESRQYGIIKDDLNEIIEKYGDERRSQITDLEIGDFNMEDLIEDEECVVTITNSGYIKRLPSDTYRTQRRGGKGVIGGKLKDDEDFVSQMYLATTHQFLLFFTNFGKVYWLKVYDIPQLSRTSRGRALPNVLSLADGEYISATIPVREFQDDAYLFLATEQGKVKKTELSAYSRPRVGGIKAIKINDGDNLVAAVITTGSNEIMLATNDGLACRFDESDCRPMGRDTAGVTGISLNDGAKVVSLLVLEAGTNVLTICEHGYGKRTEIDDYRLTKRGGKGVINIQCSDRNGPVIGSLAVADGQEVMLISRGGMVVKVPVDDIGTYGRSTQGVRIISLNDEDSLVGLAGCDAEDEDEVDGETASASPEAPAEPEGDA